MERAIFDASFFLSFLLPNEKSNQEIIKQFIQGELILTEPFIFRLEVANALRYAFASKRIKKEKLISLIKDFQKLKNINYTYDLNLQKLVQLSLKLNISLYDSCYLYLSKETGLKLYSLDKKLGKSLSV